MKWYNKLFIVGIIGASCFLAGMSADGMGKATVEKGKIVGEETTIRWQTEEGWERVEQTLRQEERQLKEQEKNEQAKKQRARFVNMDKISEIESSHNPNAISPAGARGQYQIMEATWNECVKMMGKNWSYHKCWSDSAKNKAVADFYLHIRIPQMLHCFEVPVTIETIVASYNGGVGRVRNAWRTGGSKMWKCYLPLETKDYIRKYGS